MAKYKLFNDSDSKIDAETRPISESYHTRLNHWHYGLLLTLSAAALFCLSVLYAPPARSIIGRDSLKQCASTLPPPATPPAPINLWAFLAVDDTVEIQRWLESPKRGLNLTRGDVAKASDNHVFLIEAYQPPKAAALAYLTSPSTATKPSKFARVTIHHGAAREPFVKDYLVGPLPIGAHTRLKELTEIYHRHDIPYNTRGIILEKLPKILASVMPPLAEAMQVRLLSRHTMNARIMKR